MISNLKGENVVVNTSSLPSRTIQKLLLKAHDILGLNWWATIAICTIGFRTSLIPLAVMQLKTSRRMFTGATPAMFAHLTTLTTREINAAKGDFMKQRETLRLWIKGAWRLKQHGNIKIWKLLAVPMIQFPVFIWYVSANRDLVNSNMAQYWGLHEGGMLWFPDLNRTDPTFILPVTAVGLTYLSIEMGWSFAPMIRNILHTGLVVSSAFILSQLPAGVFMYWIPSTLFSLGQGAAFRRLATMARPNVVKQSLQKSGVLQPTHAKANKTFTDVQKGLPGKSSEGSGAATNASKTAGPTNTPS